MATFERMANQTWKERIKHLGEVGKIKVRNETERCQALKAAKQLRDADEINFRVLSRAQGKGFILLAI